LSKPPEDASTARSTAIIDGPGLAHFIYYKLCESSEKSGSITYAACASETIKWLDQLREFEFDIEALLFDGALPPSKKDVRIERVQAYVTKLHAFKQLSTTNLSSISTELRKSLPPPPFLVFAVVEELLRHPHYGPVTYVVPGEADPYCVAAALELAGKDPERVVTIFSDDADLLVYNPGLNTRVIALRDLSESEFEGTLSWSATEQWPGRLASSAKFPLEDLVKPAWFMSQDLHCTLEQALSKSTIEPTDADFAAFAETFSVSAESAQWSLLKASPTLKTSLVALDSRVSELVLQVQTTATTDAVSSAVSAPPSGLRIYLPFLHDDPTRTPAWNVSTHLRNLAYSILLSHYSSSQSVQEYRRSGSRIVSTLLDPLTASSIVTQVAELASYISKALTLANQKSLNERDAWKYFAMQVVLRYLNAESMALPGLEEVVGALTGRKARKWTGVHLAAQWQAAFYALRMIRQILLVVNDHQEDGKRNENGCLRTALQELKAGLESLPRIVDFFSETLETERRGKEETWRQIVSSLLSDFGKQDGDIGKCQENEAGRPRKKAKKSKTMKVVDPELARNPFALLAD
jgi:hypothetical protein